MYDFAFSIPFGVFSIAGGIVGLVRTGHQAFAAPIVCGILFLALSVRSIKRFFRGKLSSDGVVFELLCTMGLVYLMHERYQEMQIMHPAGVMTAVSAFMVLYYSWNLTFGPKPLDPPPPYNPPKKHD